MRTDTLSHTLTLIALHGNGGGAFRFARLHEHIPADVGFIPLTLPGFAERAPDPALKSVRDYAEFVYQTVSQQQGPVVLLGTGIGGAIVLEFIQHHADSLAGIILHAPVGTQLDTRRFPALMSRPWVRRLGQWLISSRLSRPVFKRLLFQDYRHIPPEMLDRFFDEYRQCAAFSQMFDLITADWYRTLKPSDIPAGLLWGAEERVLSPDHIADYQALLPNSSVRVVAGWDHFPMLEQPADFTREVLAIAHEVLAR